jgi:hypothetical protein
MTPSADTVRVCHPMYSTVLYQVTVRLVHDSTTSTTPQPSQARLTSPPRHDNRQVEEVNVAGQDSSNSSPTNIQACLRTAGLLAIHILLRMVMHKQHLISPCAEEVE